MLICSEYKIITNRVKEFYIKFKQEKEFESFNLTPARLKLRNDLFQEEVVELEKAINENDKVEILDALVDMAYIRLGTLLENRTGNVIEVATILSENHDLEFENIEMQGLKYFGVKFSEIFIEAFEEVHRSNMTKLDENGEPIFREDGKIIKGTNYEAPNLIKILEKYGEI